MSLLVALLALVLAAALAVLCGVLLVQLRVLRRRADELAERVLDIQPAAPLAPELEAALAGGPRRLLVVEILNPLDLALSRNRAAGVLAAMAPDRLRKIVVEQAAREMAEQMVDEGVEAEVRVHVVR